MSRIVRYSLYEAKLFFRIKTAVFYSVIFPVVLLLLYYAANYSPEDTSGINAYFPYLVSITMISTAGGLASHIVHNRVYNMWKFYNFFGYQTWHMTVAAGLIYFFLGEIICLAMACVMVFALRAMPFSAAGLLLFLAAAGLGSIVYIEIAVITGLCLNDPKNAQVIINGLIYLFVILSGSIFRFSPESAIGKIMLVFPNIHIGNLLHGIWNEGRADMVSLAVTGAYMAAFGLVILYLIRRERRRLLY